MTNQDVAHRFAQNRSLTAKAGNFRCENSVLYSYTTPIAAWYDDKLVYTTKRYTATTSGKHYVALRRALDLSNPINNYFPKSQVMGKRGFYGVDIPRNWQAAADLILSDTLCLIQEALELLKSRTRGQKLLQAHHSVFELVAKAKRVISLMPEENRPTSKDYPLLEVIEALDDTWGTLEQWVPGITERKEKALAQAKDKEEKERAAQEERERLERVRQAADLELWKQGLPCETRYFHETALRVRGNLVESSKGANISITTAKKWIDAALNNKIPAGTQLDSYTVKAWAYPNLIIGCHTIPLSEVERIANDIRNA